MLKFLFLIQLTVKPHELQHGSWPETNVVMSHHIQVLHGGNDSYRKCWIMWDSEALYRNVHSSKYCWAYQLSFVWMSCSLDVIEHFFKPICFTLFCLICQAWQVPFHPNLIKHASKGEEAERNVWTFGSKMLLGDALQRPPRRVTSRLYPQVDFSYNSYRSELEGKANYYGWKVQSVDFPILKLVSTD